MLQSKVSTPGVLVEIAKRKIIKRSRGGPNNVKDFSTGKETKMEGKIFKSYSGIVVNETIKTQDRETQDRETQDCRKNLTWFQRRRLEQREQDARLASIGF